MQKKNKKKHTTEKSSTTRVNQHTPYGYFLFTHCSSDSNKNKHSFYRGADFMKKFCM